MKLLIENLLPVLILSIVTSSHITLAKVSVTDFNVDVPDNEIIDSWRHKLLNNLISSEIIIKQNCPEGEIEAEITVYKDDDIILQKNTKLDKPMIDFQNYGICASIKTPDLDDDSCSIAQGEQGASECDVSDWFSSMNPGSYAAKCDFKRDGNLIAGITLSINVESE
ncbi:uncharacterized protein LOC132906416 [Bombus pascuorum]|uniref:uncharacterized protein LOC132906416 n=1 Tax=Bombus pascuorum TaxID=65598 RepID=UPI00211F8BF9|nr:uncharacterized protein LOC132906416 [Bombus pascuorum]